MVLAYFDTCVWISAFLTRDTNHRKAVQIFNKVEHGDYIVLVTHHILSEILDFLKKESVVLTKDDLKAEALTKSEYSKFSNTLLKLPNIVIKNPNTSARDVLHPSFSLLFKYLRGMHSRSDCPICHGTFNYVGADTIFEGDALHAILAWALNCDVFITFDKDFAKLTSESLLNPMKISVL